MMFSLLRRLSFWFVLVTMAVLVQAQLARAAGSAPTIITIAAGDPGSEQDRPDNDEWAAHRDCQGHQRHNHHGREIVNVGHDSYLPENEVAEEVVSIFGSSRSEG